MSGQAAAKAAAPKTGWLFCNVLSLLLGERSQTVLNRRYEVARGDAGADKALSVAETEAEAVYPLTMDACALAKKVALALGAPVPPANSSTPSNGSLPVVAPVPQPPASSTPVGGAAVAPISSPSAPVVPPAGVGSSTVPVVTP